MAYTEKQKKDITKKAIDAIEKNKLIFIDEIIPFLPISRKTFYEWGLHKSDDLKAAIDSNKINTKVKLRNQWSDEKAAASLQIALYKLIGSDEERRILNEKVEVISDLPLDPEFTDWSDNKLIEYVNG